MTQFRVMPNAALRSPIVVSGLSFDPNTSKLLDTDDHIALALQGAGWARLLPTGTTSQRPSKAPIETQRDALYIDTTIGRVIAWDGQDWRDVLTGDAV